ncbi:MAG TPA: hypothetical protein VHP83_04890 [Aggregatilineaceae bacterium]|nr:hypothetical protein [Aggregatilineaceae bacterium]
MCVYCKAASAILDSLWTDQEFRSFFHTLGYDLGDLGSITHDIFVPAYLQVKRTLKGGTLEMLEAQVTDDVLGPLYDRPSFREAWDAWDIATRDAFLREQSEMQVGLSFLPAYAPQLAEAYQAAFRAYLQK